MDVRTKTCADISRSSTHAHRCAQRTCEAARCFCVPTRSHFTFHCLHSEVDSFLLFKSPVEQAGFFLALRETGVFVLDGTPAHFRLFGTGGEPVLCTKWSQPSCNERIASLLVPNWFSDEACVRPWPSLHQTAISGVSSPKDRRSLTFFGSLPWQVQLDCASQSGALDAEWSGMFWFAADLQLRTGSHTYTSHSSLWKRLQSALAELDSVTCHTVFLEHAYSCLAKLAKSDSVHFTQ